MSFVAALEPYTPTASQFSALQHSWQEARVPVIDDFLSRYTGFAESREALLNVADTIHDRLIEAFAKAAPAQHQSQRISADNIERFRVHLKVNEAEQTIWQAMHRGRKDLRRTLGSSEELEPGCDPLIDPAKKCMDGILKTTIRHFRDIAGKHIMVDGSYWGANRYRGPGWMAR